MSAESYKHLVDALFEKGIIGKERAIDRQTLAEVLEISPRRLRMLCEAARLEGHFVAYSVDGIFLAANEAESSEVLDKIRRECAARLRQYSALKRSLRDRGQARIKLEK